MGVGKGAGEGAKEQVGMRGHVTGMRPGSRTQEVCRVEFGIVMINVDKLDSTRMRDQGDLSHELMGKSRMCERERKGREGCKGLYIIQVVIDTCQVQVFRRVGVERRVLIVVRRVR